MTKARGGDPRGPFSWPESLALDLPHGVRATKLRANQNRGTSMSAYVIFIRNSTIDPVEFATYGQKAGPAGAGHKITPLVFYGDLEVLEGDPAEGVVIVQFPSMEEAKAWYESPAYQDAKTHRLKGADYRVILAKGL